MKHKHTYSKEKILGIIFYIIPLILLVSCSKEQEKQATIIFKNTTYNSNHPLPDEFVSHNGRIGESTISYVSSKGAINHLTARTNDTLTISTSADYIELLVQQAGTLHTSLLIKAGDTVEVFYDKLGYPVFVSREDDRLAEEYNFFNAAKPTSINATALLLTDIQAGGETVRFSKSVGNELSSGLSDANNKLRAYAAKEEVNAKYLEYYTYRFELLSMYNKCYTSEHGFTSFESKPLIDFLDDSKIEYISYRYFLNQLLFLYADNYYRTIDESEGNSNMYRVAAEFDFREIYDSLEQGKLPTKTYHLLKFLSLNEIVKKYPEEARIYYQKYEAETDNFLKEKKGLMIW